MVDYNIEVAHIYADEEFGPEQAQSLIMARQVIERLKREGKTYCVTLMIDNYNPDECFLDADEYLQTLRTCGLAVDYLVYEADLAGHSQIVMDLMDDKTRDSYQKYIKKKGMFPCSFLLSVWYLLRFGYIEDAAIIHKVSEREVTFYARHLISVVPQRFDTVEKKATKIILSTRHCELAENIQRVYY